jgi:hypothetical protein
MKSGNRPESILTTVYLQDADFAMEDNQSKKKRKSKKQRPKLSDRIQKAKMTERVLDSSGDVSVIAPAHSTSSPPFEIDSDDDFMT